MVDKVYIVSSSLDRWCDMPYIAILGSHEDAWRVVENLRSDLEPYLHKYFSITEQEVPGVRHWSPVDEETTLKGIT